ncbi:MULTISPECIES: hypothetical protein [unclassified Azospirillum]|uniref:hypothetical protein n=1 Tax=unclassified Azospirillum TaxID=2630922 RepID=UPI000B74C8A2|nr:MULTISPECIES: hypothetical protein [unclassified Azospirillum]SNS36696.1 hypothetical protein SAMN05880556_104114 [Azospirillum sp. RU38E]SNS55025.1 hypothetical protein SAMN05880591_104114 [Azospirillum sp. RU37A]
MKTCYALLTAGLLVGSSLGGTALAQSSMGTDGTAGMTSPTTGVGPEAPPTPLPSTDPMATPAPDTAATGNQMSADGMSAQQGPRVLAEIDPDSISGSGRQKNAQLTTQLLNRFNTLGFAEVKEFTRDSGVYKTEAKTSDGQWVTVMINPEEGTITQQ